MDTRPSEIIVVRSLADSDLGLFAAHRASATSKQRAVNINAPVAKILLSAEAFARGGCNIPCTIRFREDVIKGTRYFGKVGKNWRLGGRKVPGETFAALDSKDLLLIRSVKGNNGSDEILVTLVSKRLQPVVHAGICAIMERDLSGSMAVYDSAHYRFPALDEYCPNSTEEKQSNSPTAAKQATTKRARHTPVPPMPTDTLTSRASKKRKPIKEKIREPHIMERMLAVASDLSAPAQLRFMDTVGKLAEDLRELLVATGQIVSLERDHAALWSDVKGEPIGFVDGGLANLSMVGSAPIAVRVGGYTVTPGDTSPEREKFIILRQMIDELYGATGNDGLYCESFPDIGALRDAARISVEAAGAVQMAATNPDLSWLFVHGALVNPVSRYTDVIRDGSVKHRFPSFSCKSIEQLIPGTPADGLDDRERNFVSIYLRQLQTLQASTARICGIIERETTNTTLTRAIVKDLAVNQSHLIAKYLSEPPHEWAKEFMALMDPSDDEDLEGARIGDSLLFRCVLQPGEVLAPTPLDRNEMRRAPKAWHDKISQYPRPYVSYLQVSEWSPPIRIEIFEKDISEFPETARLIMHCALLLPRYAFPVGLDIVDKFARIPNWMTRPVNTHTAVQSMRMALDSGDPQLFESLRRMLCGSGREWLLRPSVLK